MTIVERRPFRVMSFDGGASSSLTLRQLRDVAKSLKKSGETGILSSTDLYVGNSAGAVAAMYLSYQMTLDPGADEIEVIEGCIDFFDQFVMAANGGPEAIARLVMGQKAAIDNTAMLNLFSATFEDAAFSSLATPVCVTSFNMQSPAEPQVKCSMALPAGEESLTIVDAAMQSSAFPLVYPLYQSHIDGAFVSNNPSMLGIGKALELSRGGTVPYFKGVNLRDTILFSMGTDGPDFTEGTFPTDDESWGWFQWLGPHWQEHLSEKNYDGLRKYLEEDMQNDIFSFETMMAVSALLYGNSQGVRTQCTQFLEPSHFMRLAFPGYKSIGELVIVIVVGLGALIAPMNIRYARQWKHGKIPTNEYNPSIEELSAWLQAQWLPTTPARSR